MEEMELPCSSLPLLLSLSIGCEKIEPFRTERYKSLSIFPIDLLTAERVLNDLLADGIISASSENDTVGGAIGKPEAGNVMGEALRNMASLRALSCLALGARKVYFGSSVVALDDSSVGRAIIRRLL